MCLLMAAVGLAMGAVVIAFERTRTTSTACDRRAEAFSMVCGGWWRGGAASKQCEGGKWVLLTPPRMGGLFVQSVAEAVAAAPRLQDEEKLQLLEKILELSEGSAPAVLGSQVRKMRTSMLDLSASRQDGSMADWASGWVKWAKGGAKSGPEGGGLGRDGGAQVSPAPSAAPSRAPTPAMRTAVVVMCYNRPQYLQRTLERMAAVFPRDHLQWPFVYVSQDGADPSVAAVVREMQERFASSFPGVQFAHWNHPQERLRGDDQLGYSKLARHFGWALGRLFALGHPRVIIVEDDLELAVDFFSFFEAVAPLLDRDPSLLAASAYNDIGQANNVGDARLIVRSDFFPGLGWMMPKRIWDEVGPKWPHAYWDDWLREPAQRKDRHVLRPEVSRSRTFGEKGVSRSQFFGKFLATIHLNDRPVDFRSLDLSYLEKAAWDALFLAALRDSFAAPSLEDALDPEAASARCNDPSGPRNTNYPPFEPGFLIRYEGLDSQNVLGSGSSFAAIANGLQIINDAKAGVPRTAYHGVVTLVRNRCRLFLVPADMQF
jgi:alpha-1,3-mannosyl-glycoprotein beta-1,2-N-acetylglucosaminyltransferase